MLTVLELSQLIDKSENIIRYWITHDERFKECFWQKKELEFNNNSGKYKKSAWVCDEGDITRIVDWLASKRQLPTMQKKYWSDIAIHCYERKMRCSGCTFLRYCGQYERPPMKTKVLELVKKYGEPR